MSFDPRLTAESDDPSDDGSVEHRRRRDGRRRRPVRGRRADGGARCGRPTGRARRWGRWTAWPQALRVAVGICLNSPLPDVRVVGAAPDQHLQRRVHPRAGQAPPRARSAGRRADIWGEIWPVVGPQADAVMTRGEATWNERVLLVMERHGFTEDTWFTWSYSPIPDESGAIGGLFCACTEETATVLAERERDRLLVEAESERARLAAAFAQSPAFLAVLRGPDHVFEFVNERYHQLIGRRDIIGKPVRQVHAGRGGAGLLRDPRPRLRHRRAVRRDGHADRVPAGARRPRARDLPRLRLPADARPRRVARRHPGARRRHHRPPAGRRGRCARPSAATARCSSRCRTR